MDRQKSGPCTPHRDPRHRPPIAARDSGPGAPTTPAGDRLRLLPSGPDLVHKPTPRGTRTIDAPNSGATGAKPLGREFSPARADCGFRAPLPPRLARSGSILARWRRSRPADPAPTPDSPVRLASHSLTVARRPRFALGCATVTYFKRISNPPRHRHRDARRRGPDRRLRLQRLEQLDRRRRREHRRPGAGDRHLEHARLHVAHDGDRENARRPARCRKSRR